MEALKFRTDIGCATCVKAASFFLDGNNQILHWQIDINHPDRILTLRDIQINKLKVMYDLRFAGFKIESTE
jgi:copper chaperone